MEGFPILTVLIFVPLVGTAVISALPARFEKATVARNTAVGFSLVTLVLAAIVLIDFDTAIGSLQFVDRATWIAPSGIQWLVGVNGISIFMVALTAFLFPLCFIFLKQPEQNRRPYFALILMLQSGCLGAFLAQDLFLFFVFFEVVLVPMYFLIGRFGHARAKFASAKFFIFTMAGSALMLVGILAVALLTANKTGAPLTFDVESLAIADALSVAEARWVFLAFAIGFGVKVPLFPIHIWLPDAHTEAPTAGSIILAGVLLKLGTYGFLRFGIFLFPEAADFFAPVLMGLAVVGILYGAVVATMQKDLKRLVAYSSIAHLGFVVLGLFALNSQGISGAVLQMLNHGLSTGALFLLVGYLYERRHTRQISELEGIQKVAPIFAALFTVVMLSSIGLPGLNGFVGEFLILLGAFDAHRWFAVVATSGVILAAVYLLWAYKRVFHGPVEGENAKTPDLKWKERIGVGLFIVPIVLIGVYPRLLLNRIEPAVDNTIAHIQNVIGTEIDLTGEHESPHSEEGGEHR